MDNFRDQATRAAAGKTDGLFEDLPLHFANDLPAHFESDFGPHLGRRIVDAARLSFASSSGITACSWAGFSWVELSEAVAKSRSSKSSRLLRSEDCAAAVCSRCLARIQPATRDWTSASTHWSKTSISCFRRFARSLSRASSNASREWREQVARYSNIGLFVFIGPLQIALKPNRPQSAYSTHRRTMTHMSIRNNHPQAAVFLGSMLARAVGRPGREGRGE